MSGATPFNPKVPYGILISTAGAKKLTMGRGECFAASWLLEAAASDLARQGPTRVPALLRKAAAKWRVAAEAR